MTLLDIHGTAKPEAELVKTVANQIYTGWDGDVPVRELLVAAVQVGMDLAVGRRRTIGGLTERQRRLLLFIVAFTDENGFAPSFDQMKDNLGLKSKSGVHRLVHALEERGAIAQRANRARAIEVLALPMQVSP